MSKMTVRKALGNAVEYMIRHGRTRILTFKNMKSGWIRRFIETEMERPVGNSTVTQAFREMREDGEIVVKRKGDRFEILQIRGMDTEDMLKAVKQQPELF